jgi:hypothetical protein
VAGNVSVPVELVERRAASNACIPSVRIEICDCGTPELEAGDLFSLDEEAIAHSD